MAEKRTETEEPKERPTVIRGFWTAWRYFAHRYLVVPPPDLEEMDATAEMVRPRWTHLAPTGKRHKPGHRSRPSRRPASKDRRKRGRGWGR